MTLTYFQSLSEVWKEMFYSMLAFVSKSGDNVLVLTFCFFFRSTFVLKAIQHCILHVTVDTLTLSNTCWTMVQIKM